MNNFDKEDLKRQAKHEQNIATVKDAVKEMFDVIPHIAKLYREYYKALKAQGFTNEQAITLIAHHGTSLGIEVPKDQK